MFVYKKEDEKKFIRYQRINRGHNSYKDRGRNSSVINVLINRRQSNTTEHA